MEGYSPTGHTALQRSPEGSQLRLHDINLAHEEDHLTKNLSLPNSVHVSGKNSNSKTTVFARTSS